MSKLSGLEPPEECTICGWKYDEEEGGVQGYFGILPVTFCADCLTNILNMADQLNGEYDA